MKRRWYLWILGAILLAAGGLTVEWGYLAAHTLTLPAPPYLPNKGYLAVIGVLVGAAAVWVSWVCAFMLAGDPLQRQLIRPRGTLAWLSMVIWQPALYADAVLILLFVMRPSYPKSQVFPALLFPWLGYIAVALVPVHIWCWWWNLRVRARFRDTAGKIVCLRCGYDLRGTPAGGVCPECGERRTIHADRLAP